MDAVKRVRVCVVAGKRRTMKASTRPSTTLTTPEGKKEIQEEISPWKTLFTTCGILGRAGHDSLAVAEMR